LDDYSIPDGAHIHLLLRFGHGWWLDYSINIIILVP
jgi:hypothetical protein